MGTAYAEDSPTAFRKTGIVAERLRNAKATAIADALGKSDSWVDKVRNGESGVLIADLPALCAALNVKIVSADKVCVDRDVYISLKTIAGAALEAPQKLEWE